MKKFIFLIFYFICITFATVYAQEQTYAEKLGFKKGQKVIILHIDDAGMSYDSNAGTIKALEEGVANSVSVMMTCPWVPGFVKYLKENPDTDAGLHLTLTSEWDDYRWGPLMGKPAVPSLVDQEGALWKSVGEVVQHASADEVEKEIRAQIERARTMGFEPTHLDSHMGTLFASPHFTERYVKIGIEYQIPVMFPGGHNTALISQMTAGLKSSGEFKEGQEHPVPPAILQAREMGKQIWNAGLPILDDLHNESYEWTLPKGMVATDKNLQDFKVERYIEALKNLKPGLTMVIMHCTAPTEVFEHISVSGDTRKGDLLAMIDPRLREFIQKEGIVLTTWREVMERRKRVGN